VGEDKKEIFSARDFGKPGKGICQDARFPGYKNGAPRRMLGNYGLTRLGKFNWWSQQPRSKNTKQEATRLALADQTTRLRQELKTYFRMLASPEL
jgi:hypothetical protein